MQDDVRPFLVNANGQWSRTGNVGGAEFLRYTTEREWYWIRRMLAYAVPTQQSAPTSQTSPTLASPPTAASRPAPPHLVASDDLVRTYVHLSFEFLEDVTYDRLAFFQVAADNYSDRGFRRWPGAATGVEQDTTVRPNHTRIRQRQRPGRGRGRRALQFSTATPSRRATSTRPPPTWGT